MLYFGTRMDQLARLALNYVQRFLKVGGHRGAGRELGGHRG